LVLVRLLEYLQQAHRFSIQLVLLVLPQPSQLLNLQHLLLQILLSLYWTGLSREQVKAGREGLSVSGLSLEIL
jgi:hypothetical protein